MDNNYLTLYLFAMGSNSRSFLFRNIFSHYFEPEIPQIDGLDSFNGVVMHSHNYRQPDMFAGKQIVCIGAAASGIDIAIELATTANQVTIE
jgi:cation diffusion facilitator CzcD-associated flavoprotein CzcO